MNRHAPASQVPFTPIAGITASDVQAAFAQVLNKSTTLQQKNGSLSIGYTPGVGNNRETIITDAGINLNRYDNGFYATINPSSINYGQYQSGTSTVDGLTKFLMGRGIKTNNSVYGLLLRAKTTGAELASVILSDDGSGDAFANLVLGYTNRLTFVNNGSQVLAANNIGVYFGGVGFTPTALADLGASTTSVSSFRIRSGVAPTVPNDGDIWYDGTRLNQRIGTTSTELINSGATAQTKSGLMTFTGGVRSTTANNAEVYGNGANSGTSNWLVVGRSATGTGISQNGIPGFQIGNSGSSTGTSSGNLGPNTVSGAFSLCLATGGDGTGTISGVSSVLIGNGSGVSLTNNNVVMLATGSSKNVASTENSQLHIAGVSTGAAQANPLSIASYYGVGSTHTAGIAAQRKHNVQRGSLPSYDGPTATYTTRWQMFGVSSTNDVLTEREAIRYESTQTGALTSIGGGAVSPLGAPLRVIGNTEITSSLVIGAAVAGVTAAPTNGLLVQGIISSPGTTAGSQNFGTNTVGAGITVGNGNSAADQSLACGNGNTATGVANTVVGFQNSATGQPNQVVVGRGNTSTAQSSVSVGISLNNSGGGVSLGSVFSNAFNAFGVGGQTKVEASGDKAFCFGNSGALKLQTLAGFGPDGGLTVNDFAIAHTTSGAGAAVAGRTTNTTFIGYSGQSTAFEFLRATTTTTGIQSSIGGGTVSTTGAALKVYGNTEFTGVISPNVFTVATLPSAPPTGSISSASNARVVVSHNVTTGAPVLEASGSGTGSSVNFHGSWRLPGTNITAQA